MLMDQAKSTDMLETAGHFGEIVWAIIDVTSVESRPPTVAPVWTARMVVCHLPPLFRQRRILCSHQRRPYFEVIGVATSGHREAADLGYREVPILVKRLNLRKRGLEGRVLVRNIG
jgi:hypothetical protein